MWLQAQSASEAVMTLADKRKYLARVIRTPAGLVDETSDLCAKFKRVPGGRSISMPDKIGAIALDSRLAGDLPPLRSTKRSGRETRQD